MFCIECGTKLEANQKFCKNCGSPINISTEKKEPLNTFNPGNEFKENEKLNQKRLNSAMSFVSKIIAVPAGFVIFAIIRALIRGLIKGLNN